MFELFKSLWSLIVRQFLEPLSNFHCAMLTLYNLNFMNPKIVHSIGLSGARHGGECTPLGPLSITI